MASRGITFLALQLLFEETGMKTLIIALCLVSSMAFSETTKKQQRTVDMTVVLHDAHGQPFPDCIKLSDDGKNCAKFQPLTLGAAIATALYDTYPNEQIDGKQKWARGILAQRIEFQKDAQLTAEEVSTIKELVGKAYGVLVVMQVYPAIDPNDKPDTLKP